LLANLAIREDCSRRRRKVVEFPLKISLEADEKVRHLDTVRNIIENLLTLRTIFKNPISLRQVGVYFPSLECFWSAEQNLRGGCENRTTRNHFQRRVGARHAGFFPFPVTPIELSRHHSLEIKF